MIRASSAGAIVWRRRNHRSVVVVPSPWGVLGGTLLAVGAAAFGVASAVVPWPVIVAALAVGPFLHTRFVVTTRDHRATFTALALVPVWRTGRAASATYFRRMGTEQDWNGEPGPVTRFFAGAVGNSALPAVPCLRPNALAALLEAEVGHVRGLPGAVLVPPADEDGGA